VHKPPPELMAQKTYTKNWIFRRSEAASKKKTYEHTKDSVLSKNKKNVEQEPKPAETEQQTSAPITETVPKKEEVESTLQEYFDTLLVERGYDIKTYETLSTGYYNKASAHQVASYGPRMVQIVKSNDIAALRETLDGGLSANPCNQFGESLLHMICRRGDTDLLTVFIEAGTVLQVSDDYGRIPLHDACWAAKPAFGVVEQILARDSFMFFMKDRRGAQPLSYVHKDDWAQWRDWFDENIDTYFPESGAASFKPSDLCSVPPNSFPIQDGKSDLSLELIKMVAFGELSPKEAREVAETARREEDEETIAATVVDDGSDSEFDSDYDSDFDSDYDDSDYESDMENEELYEMLQIAQVARAGS